VILSPTMSRGDEVRFTARGASGMRSQVNTEDNLLHAVIGLAALAAG
jgi:hypothetical protein